MTLHWPDHHPQVNAGQANAATGEQGYQDSLASADAVAQALGVPRDDVLLESTGVIGRQARGIGGAGALYRGCLAGM